MVARRIPSRRHHRRHLHLIKDQAGAVSAAGKLAGQPSALCGRQSRGHSVISRGARHLITVIRPAGLAQGPAALRTRDGHLPGAVGLGRGA